MLLIAFCFLRHGWYGTYEILAAWLLFTVVFVAGAVVIVAAYLVGGAASYAIRWARDAVHAISGNLPPTSFERAWLDKRID